MSLRANCEVAPIISSSEQLRKPQELGCRTSKWRSRDKSSVCLASRQRPELLHRSVDVSGPPVSVQSAPSQRVAFAKAARSPRSEPGRPPPRVCYGLPGERSGDQFQSATEEHKLSPAPSEEGRSPVGCPHPHPVPRASGRDRVRKHPPREGGLRAGSLGTSRCWKAGRVAVIRLPARHCCSATNPSFILHMGVAGHLPRAGHTEGLVWWPRPLWLFHQFQKVQGIFAHVTVFI